MAPTNRIYLDYQGSTPVDPRVAVAMDAWGAERCGNPHAEHSYGWEAHKAIAEAAESIGTSLGRDPDEVVFTSGATEANCLAILGAALRAPPNRRRILVSAIEHKSVLNAARTAEKFGCVVEAVGVDRDGHLQEDQFRSLLSDDVLLVSIMCANNEIGAMQLVEKFAQDAVAVGALFHTDATQAIVARGFDLADTEISLLSLSGHKICGPKGVGALLIDRNVRSRLEPLFVGGGQQGGIRGGTLPTPLCVGLGHAIKLTNEARTDEVGRIRQLRDKLITALTTSDHRIEINGALDHPGILNVRVIGIDSRHLLDAIQPAVAAATGSACTSGDVEPSYVLRAIGLSNQAASESLRLGVGRFSTDGDIEIAANIITAAIRNISRTIGDGHEEARSKAHGQVA